MSTIGSLSVAIIAAKCEDYCGMQSQSVLLVYYTHICKPYADTLIENIKSWNATFFGYTIRSACTNSAYITL